MTRRENITHLLSTNRVIYVCFGNVIFSLFDFQEQRVKVYKGDD